MFYVYHIKLPEHGVDEGYVGVSVNPKERWSNHKSREENLILSRAIQKYGRELQYKILGVFDTLSEALWQEFTLRPTDRLGWNLVKGGGMPPNMGGWNKGLTTPISVKEKQSAVRMGRFSGKEHPRARIANIYDYETGEILAESVVIRNWAKENGYHQAHLAATATGKHTKHKGIYARYI